VEALVVSGQQKIQDTGFRWESHPDQLWNVNGPILVRFQEKGQTVTSARYSDMLVNELKPTIRSKRRGLLSKRVLLHHDNARPHTAARTVDKLHALKFEVFEHPPYSPDLAPSDFHLFGPMKEHLRG
jgi:histone-lysine N-methyltransferase SETMAR